jgi:hypothetical protein
LASTVYDTDPFPLPLAPAVIVTHAAALDAVQAHPAPAVTLTLPVVASAPVDTVVGDNEYEQTAPSCVTVKVCPPIVSVPVRDADEGLAETL